MDRIKEAMQRAREERAELIGQRGQSSETRVPRVEPVRVEYKQTPVVEVSKKKLRNRRVITADEDDQAAAAYRVLRTQVLRRMQAQSWTTLAITSAAPSEGKSLTAVNLAISMARQFANTVLLVDLDLRRPAVATFFGGESRYGLSDHLTKGVPLEEVLFNPGIEHLVVLPAGSPQTNASEILRSSEMVEFTRELKARYKNRLILFDLPPMLVGDDALGFLPCVECVLLVIEDGKTHPDQLNRAVELLKDSNVIGSVLNKCKNPERNHYYEYY